MIEHSLSLKMSILYKFIIHKKLVLVELNAFWIVMQRTSHQESGIPIQYKYHRNYTENLNGFPYTIVFGVCNFDDCGN